MNNPEFFLESLESRIAPAGVTILAGGKTASFYDGDGDYVVVKITKGTLTEANFTTTATGDGYQLNTLDISGLGFVGTDLTITAARNLTFGGDGFVNIGQVKAVATKLGNVTIPGDVGQFEIGDGSTEPAQVIKSLKIGSLAAFGMDTGASAGLQSNIYGSIGAFTVATDFYGKFVVNGSTTDGKTGGIGTATIGGSLIGTADYTGWLQSSGNIGTLKVGGDLHGDGIQSGRIQSVYGSIGSATIGGSLLGISGDDSGQLIANRSIGSVTIGGSLVGGSGDNSGYVGASVISTITVKGSLLGNSGDNSGSMYATIVKANVGGDLRGGSGNSSGEVITGNSTKGATVVIEGSLYGGGGVNSGIVDGNNKSITVNGSLTGGSGDNSGGVFNESTGIKTKVSIKGNVTGGAGMSSGAIGNTTDFHFDTITIGGNLTGSGYGYAGSIYAGSVTSVKIGGSLTGSATGTGLYSGAIVLAGNSGTITVGANIQGGAQNYSGGIYVFGALKSVTVGGSIIGGSGSSTISGSIAIQTTLGSVSVGRDVQGDASHPVRITAGGLGAALSAKASQDLAIGKISIGGSSTYGVFQAGAVDAGGALIAYNGDASIGPVTVGRDWITSSISAGISAGTDGFFGTDAMSDDANLASPTGRNLLSTITSIVIKGQVRGTYATANDSYAFTAEKLGTLKIGTIDYTKEINNTTAAQIFLGPVFTLLSDIRAIERLDT